MILNGSRDNLSSRCRQAIYQDHERIIFATIAMLRHITHFRRSTAMMGNNELILLEELVGYAHAFAQQATGISPQIQYQTFQVAELIQSLGNFFFRSLVESSHVQVTDARTDQEVNVDAVTRNLIPHQRKLHQLLNTLA